MLDRKTILRPITIKFRPWVILLFVLCPPMWVLVGLAIWAVPWDSPNAPAWVQAVGSIGAILIAVWVVQAQQRARENERKRKELHYMVKAFYTADFIAGALEIVVEEAKKSPLGTAALKVYLERLEEAITEARDFHFSNMADHNFAMAWITFRRFLYILTALLADQSQNGSVNHFASAANLDMLVKAVAARNKMRASLNAHKGVVGPEVWTSHHP